MTPRIFPGCIVDHPSRGRCSVVSMVVGGEVPKANLRCGRDRIEDVPLWLLVHVAPPPAVPKLHLRGLA